MKKIIFGIFAHPDDEAFGPAGTLKKEALDGTEVRLVALTDGDAGSNPDGYDNLGEMRRKELQESSRLLGAKSVKFFGYEDGRLNNSNMIEIGQRLVKYTSSVAADAPDDAKIEFMTLDHNGYTGHIDHIVAARAASWAFFTQKQADDRFSRIRYACLPQHLYPEDNLDWLYMEAGRMPEEIDEIVDARDLREDIIKIMRAHHSQRRDCNAAIKLQGNELGLNYFIVKN